MQEVVQVDRRVAVRDRAFDNGPDRQCIKAGARQDATELVATPFHPANDVRAEKDARRRAIGADGVGIAYQPRRNAGEEPVAQPGGTGLR